MESMVYGRMIKMNKIRGMLGKLKDLLLLAWTMIISVKGTAVLPAKYIVNKHKEEDMLKIKENQETADRHAEIIEHKTIQAKNLDVFDSINSNLNRNINVNLNSNQGMNRGFK